MLPRWYIYYPLFLQSAISTDNSSVRNKILLHWNAESVWNSNKHILLISSFDNFHSNTYLSHIAIVPSFHCMKYKKTEVTEQLLTANMSQNQNFNKYFIYKQDIILCILCYSTLPMLNLCQKIWLLKQTITY